MGRVNTCVVSDYECEAPAGWSSGAGYSTNNMFGVGKTKCYVCGEPVCLKCSSIVTWYGKRVRACNNCKDSYKIEEQEFTTEEKAMGKSIYASAHSCLLSEVEPTDKGLYEVTEAVAWFMRRIKELEA